MQIPFGKSTAYRNNSINAFYDMASSVTSTLESYEAIGNGADFSHLGAYVGLQDLSLMASCSTPV